MIRRSADKRRHKKSSVSMLQKGSVKMYDNDRGFGFILPEMGGNDVFVHRNELHHSGIYEGLKENQSVLFRTFYQADGRAAATEVKIDSMQNVIALDQDCWYHGCIKWFDQKKGYGFITPVGGGKDIFLHYSSLRNSGLNEAHCFSGQGIRCKVAPGKGGGLKVVQVEFI